MLFGILDTLYHYFFIIIIIIILTLKLQNMALDGLHAV